MAIPYDANGNPTMSRTMQGVVSPNGAIPGSYANNSTGINYRPTPPSNIYELNSKQFQLYTLLIDNAGTLLRINDILDLSTTDNAQDIAHKITELVDNHHLRHCKWKVTFTFIP